MHEHAGHGMALGDLLIHGSTGGAGWLTIAAGLFLTGLAGGFAHCGGMCGPFVLAQVGRTIGSGTSTSYLALTRLQGGALLPYHAGRIMTYAGLGGLSGGLAGGIGDLPGLRWIPAFALASAAMFFLALFLQKLWPRLDLISPVAGPIAGWIAGRTQNLAGRHGFLLGLGLGLLPCGMVYAALGAAAGAGGYLQGAVAMAAFGAGTVPALLVVGFAGAATMRGFRHRFGFLVVPLFLINAVMLGFFAFKAAN